MKRFREILRRLQIVKLFSALYRYKLVQIIIPAAVILFIYWEGQKEFRRIDWAGTLHTLHHMKPATVLLLFGFALIAVATVSLYDFVLRRHFQIPLSFWETFRYSWIANTSNSVIGFSGIAGAALRTFLYRKRKIPAQTITASIAFLSTITITGLSVLSWAGILGILPMQPVLQSHPWTIYAVWAAALYLPGYLILQRTSFYAKWLNRNLPRMDAATIAASVGASLLEWAFAGISFWLIGSCFLPALSLAQALGIYTLSAITGLLSMAPGGIGGFDLTALLGLQQLGYPSGKTAAVLVLFRLLYYLFPWGIGLVLAAFDFARGREGEDGRDNAGYESVLNNWQKIWLFPTRLGVVGEIGAWSLGKLVFASGIVLLLSAATPGLLNRLQFAEELLSAPLMRLSHQLSVIIGLLLLVLSWGISHRVKRAYRLTLFFLCAGALFTFTKAFDFEEAIFLLIVALLLWISRNRFFRVATPVDPGKAALWGLVTLLAAYVYDLIATGIPPAILKHWPSNAKLMWLINPKQHAAAAIAGLVMAWLLITLFFILRPNRLTNKGASDAELARLRKFLEHEQGNLLTHVLFAGDKSFFWACNDQVLIPYAIVRREFVVLGDPIGKENLVSEAIQESQRFADLYDLTVVFYQVSPHYLPIYHENGYRFFKLGEEALVSLEHFTLSGKPSASLRSVTNRFEREGFRFEVVQPPHPEDLMKQLYEISQKWLDGKKEKGFSLGWFDEDYLQQSTLSLLSSPNGEIIAFASLAPGYDNGNTLSVDLMRNLPVKPNGTMDHLFVSLLKWAKEQGYAYFNLGMAPLSSVGQTQSAIREEKLAHLVFKHGGHWYGFLGLRKYKEKFSPVWEPRYLAYPSQVSLPILLLELVRLIARRPNKE
ncbi:bifunctional lysylphosphatidylglycerol flippase/synthetase MprF [Paenibacillus riograndensis]|uniref:Phosphatidylglycerol lysyltransferase n=3 Tax=Paenibacillus riograndensis TaxID=483937 RepID=A0A0E4H8V9_9BACL|nr:bifunctional lysylphosphatidylglycerol flippase/synthetase MprF [Paenibacillus riograndensis]CQR54604.1 lysylcardiolipin synthase / lysyltransferase [Paenibacillus riograndensis SBR5]